MKLANAKVEKVFNTLFSVDKSSPNLDFSIRFKNKTNFKNLKEAYISLTDTLNEIFEKYWEKSIENWKVFWKFWDNKDLVNNEIKNIYDIEVELALTQVEIICKLDPITNKTDTMWLNITQDEIDILEDIFTFTVQ